jgi:nicotinamide-nucleotide amidase
MFEHHAVQADLISIGDELLIGQVVNTNAAWLSKALNDAGVSVRQHLAVSDSNNAIEEAFLQASQRVSFCIVTGGLGPTKDDITKSVIARLTNSPLSIREAVLRQLETRYRLLNRNLSALNRLQAEIPESCHFFQNHLGTAPGLWFEFKSCIFYCLPGVPYEMKALFSESVLPDLKAKFKMPEIRHTTLITSGIAESALAELLETWENELPFLNLKLAYLPRPGQVRLRISGTDAVAERLEERMEKARQSLMPLIQSYYMGTERMDGEPFDLARLLVQKLQSLQMTVAVAESCTGGQLSAAITAIPGASAVFKGSCVPYSNAMKQTLLQVPQQVFETEGAVSQRCVELMALGCKNLFQSDLAVSISGIAGPGGATAEKPVGLVWMGFAVNSQVVSKSFIFGADRLRNIEYSVQNALRIALTKI